MATVTAPIALDSTLQSTNTALTAQNALLTSANSNSLADVMEDGIANIVTAIGAIPTPTAANVSFDDSQAGLGESNVQGAINALNDNLANSNAGAHNAIYRGKSLGSSVTADQYSEISAGTFKDLYIGDYWTIGGVVYRIADFDYFLRSGDTECTTHHIALVPDASLYNAQMNTSNTTSGAYAGSKMYTTNLATAKSTIQSAFGSAHILSHREYLANAVSNGRQSAGAWYDSTVELMTESMIYGAFRYAPACDGSIIPDNYTIACKQLNLFRHRPDMISNRQNYWLRDVVSAAHFAFVSLDGGCSYSSASYAGGVRPAFCIIG